MTFDGGSQFVRLEALAVKLIDLGFNLLDHEVLSMLKLHHPKERLKPSLILLVLEGSA